MPLNDSGRPWSKVKVVRPEKSWVALGWDGHDGALAGAGGMEQERVSSGKVQAKGRQEARRSYQEDEDGRDGFGAGELAVAVPGVGTREQEMLVAVISRRMADERWSRRRSRDEVAERVRRHGKTGTGTRSGPGVWGVFPRGLSLSV